MLDFSKAAITAAVALIVIWLGAKMLFAAANM